MRRRTFLQLAGVGLLNQFAAPKPILKISVVRRLCLPHLLAEAPLATMDQVILANGSAISSGCLPTSTRAIRSPIPKLFLKWIRRGAPLRTTHTKWETTVWSLLSPITATSRFARMKVVQSF